MCRLIGAYVPSVFGGFVVVGLLMALMRETVRRRLKKWRFVPVRGKRKEQSFAPLDFWIGGTERAVATTLVAFAPSYLATFIGGWVALKFAANWKRQSDNDPASAQGSLLFLIGNVVCRFRSRSPQGFGQPQNNGLGCSSHANAHDPAHCHFKADLF